MKINNDYSKYRDQKNYQAWKVSLSDFQEKWRLKNKILFFLKYGILAPSTHNSQPWTFEFSEPNKITIKPNWERKLIAADPNNRNLYISLGCSLTNIRISAGYFGFGIEEEIKKIDNEYRIYLEFKKGKIFHDLSRLAPEISRRFSDKSIYLDKLVPKKFLNLTEKNVAKSGQKISYVLSQGSRDLIADMYLNIGSQYSADPSFRSELSKWLKQNDTRDGDGMPGFVSGLSLIQSKIGKFLIKYLPPLPKIQVKKDSEHLRRGPVIGLISSSSNQPADYIRTGELYQEIALLSSEVGLSMTPMTALIEKTESHAGLKKIFKFSQPHPQMFFRLGYSKAGYYHTPRNSVEEHLY